MREMKKTNIDWIGDIPSSWKVGKVKDVFIRKNVKANIDNPMVLSLARSGVKIRDISTGEGQLAKSYNNYNPVEVDDLLLNPMDLYSGANCSVSKVRGVISPAYINLRAKVNNNPTYYDYYFKTQYWSMAFFAHGKGVSFDNRWTLGIDTALNYYVPIPSTKEQEKIANFLDNKIAEIDNVIEKTKETIEDYKKYKQSLITRVVTTGLNEYVETKDSGIDWIGKIPHNWNKARIKNIAQVFGRIGFKGYTQNDFVNEGEGAITLSPSNFNDLRMDYGKVSYLRWEKYEESPEIQINNGDILFVKTGSSYGKVCLVKDLPMESTINPQMIVFKNISIDNKFFTYALYSTYIQYQTEISVTGGIIPTMSQEKINNFYIIIPPYEEQKIICNYIDKNLKLIDDIVTEKIRIINELEQYKKSLIYEYVTGKKEVI